MSAVIAPGGYDVCLRIDSKAAFNRYRIGWVYTKPLKGDGGVVVKYKGYMSVVRMESRTCVGNKIGGRVYFKFTPLMPKKQSL